MAIQVRQATRKGPLRDAKVIYRVPPDSAGVYAPQADFHDRFNRADDTDIGSMETGEAWAAVAGTFGIYTNTAGLNDTAAVTSPIYVETNQADVEITYVISDTSATSYGSIFRSHGNDTAYVYFYDFPPGPTTFLEFYSDTGQHVVASGAGGLTKGQTVKIVAKGSLINVYVDGALNLSGTIATNATQTKHGPIQFGAENDARFDDFTVREI